MRPACPPIPTSTPSTAVVPDPSVGRPNDSDKDRLTSKVMARRRYYRSSSWGWGGAEWAEYHRRKRHEVTQRFGGIDEDIEAIFLNLSPGQLTGLFQEYEGRHGWNAAAYTRKTYPKWKSGSVMLSGQTALRLLDLLPPYLSSDIRYELIRKLRRHCIARSSVRVSCEPANWRETIDPAVEAVISHSRSQELPLHVTSVATWLTNNDSRAAEKLLVAAEEEEALIRTRLLAQEFARIDSLVQAYDKSRPAISHIISLPQGEIHVTIGSHHTLGARLLAFLRRLWG